MPPLRRARPPRALCRADRVRVLMVFDGDAERSRRVIELMLGEVMEALGPEHFAAALDLRELDLSVETSRRRQRAECHAAELVVGLDAEHLRGLSRPLRARERIFTIEELTFTLETVATAPGALSIVSILGHGYTAFARSVIAAACSSRGLVHSLFLDRRRAGSVEGYAPRLARALSELAIGRALAD